jgi:hypothetical protein
MTKTRKFRGRRYRNGTTRKRAGRGGDLAANMMNAVKQGLRQGIQNTPRALYKSLRSSGSTYGSPGNSIASLAGNNIANILRANENALRSEIGKGLSQLRIRSPSSSSGRSTMPSSPITPITPRSSSPKLPFPSANLMRQNIIVRPLAIRPTVVKPTALAAIAAAEKAGQYHLE